ncbi:MAG: histidine--tRNA ligase, partial [Acidobacteria bacterium]|nr:histidine--tRNA ligase [Acidobacteriota bacterium]
MASTQPARGMRDFLPADVRKRDYVIGVIKEVYESYGFEPLETPAVENIDTLMGKYGDEGNQLIFKILKRGEKLVQSARVLSEREDSTPLNDLADLALRYDLTVPLARVVANNRNELPKFFKRYQIQPVWRADRPARGRFREFYQCDVDAIGSKSMVVEAEIIGAASEILSRLGFDDFAIRINHRQLLSKMVADAGIENESDALVALDKLDKVGADGVKKELLNRAITAEAADAFLSSVTGDVSNAELDRVVELCNSSRVKVDPSLARGLSYYTGTIMEINVPDLAGSLGGGGRYDGLIGMFGKEQIPACGFSLGLERILVVMDERGMFPAKIAESAPADVLVTIWSDETASESLKLAQELRAAGLRVTLYPEPDKL